MTQQDKMMEKIEKNDPIRENNGLAML